MTPSNTTRNHHEQAARPTLPYPSLDNTSKSPVSYTRLLNGDFAEPALVSTSLMPFEAFKSPADGNAMDFDFLDSTRDRIQEPRLSGNQNHEMVNKTMTASNSQLDKSNKTAPGAVDSGTEQARNTTRESWSKNQTRFLLACRMQHMCSTTGKIDWQLIEADYHSRFPGSPRNAHSLRKKAADLDKLLEKPLVGQPGTRRRWDYVLESDIAP